MSRAVSRAAIAIAVASIALSACSVMPASERTLALVQPRLPAAGEVYTYAALDEVPGRIRVVAEIEVPNDGEKRSAIEARLRSVAQSQGANAIVLHPFNRWALGAGYKDGGWDGFDPFRNSRATAIIVETRPAS